MKKLVASVGLFAVGASGVQAASAAALTAEPSKFWSVSATLRGFYDDNLGTVGDGFQKTRTFGFEISPSFSLSWPLEQTLLSLGYVYSFRWYEKRVPLFDPTTGLPLKTDKYDQTHSFTALMNHAFSERYVLNVQDSFVIGQEPDFLRAGTTFTTFQRVPGDNIRNYGNIKFNAQITHLFGIEVGYENSFFHYDDEGGNAFSPSRAGLLDRIEQYVHLDGRWQLQPQTVGVVGYQYGQTDYTGDEEIGFDPLLGVFYRSDARNQRSHFAYVGVDHSFRPDLSGAVRVGVRYTDYYNAPTSSDSISPFARASLQYTYAPESHLDLSISHDRNATDLFSASAGNITVDQESTAVAGSVTHRIVPRLFGSLVAQFQNSTVNGGSINDVSERYYLVGLNVEYQFNPHFSAHAGYNYDKLDSDVLGRSFDRNRVYVGVTASY